MNLYIMNKLMNDKKIKTIKQKWQTSKYFFLK